MSAAAFVGALAGPVEKILGKFIQDKDEAARLAFEISSLAEKQAHEISLSQIEVNKEEAKSHSLFVSGWRPAVGWVCVLAMINNFILIPYVSAFLDVKPMDWAAMSPILLGILGLGGMRTAEKVKGVARKK